MISRMALVSPWQDRLLVLPAFLQRGAGRRGSPVEIDAAGAWLRAGADPDPGGKAWRAAEDLYLKRVEDDLYLRRCYPDFAHLCADGGFFRWAETLYGEATRAIRSAAAAAESEA